MGSLRAPRYLLRLHAGKAKMEPCVTVTWASQAARRGVRPDSIMRVPAGKAERRRAGRAPCNAHSRLFAPVPLSASACNKDGRWIYSGLCVASFL